MDFRLSIKQKQIRRMARQFAKAELAPIAKEIDEEGRFPWEAVEKMGPLNFFGMQAPRQYGGAEMDSISYCLVIEEISRVCAAMGLTLAVHNGVAVYPLRRCEKIGFHNRDISDKAQISRRSGLIIMKKASCAP